MKKLLFPLFFALMIPSAVFAGDTMFIRCGETSIEVPFGWLAQYTKSPNIFIIYSPVEQNDTFQENGNLTVEALPVPYTVEEYMRAGNEIMSTIYRKYQVIESSEHWHVITGILNDTLLQQIQYFYIRDNTAYVLTFTAIPESFDRYRPVFDSIAASFDY